MRFIELFAGIGGFRYGLERCGIKDTTTLETKRQEEGEENIRIKGGQSCEQPDRRSDGFTNSPKYGLKANDTVTERTQQGIQQGSKSNSTIVKSFLGTKQFTCVFANEWDKYACQIYRKNFGLEKSREQKSIGQGAIGGDIRQSRVVPGSNERGKQSKPKEGYRLFNGLRNDKWNEASKLYQGDIRSVSAKSIPDHDLLVGGFPCQAFSIAGKRKGFGDTRGTLFFEICRIVEEKKPNLLLLENVKGLLNHDGGNTLRIILNSLSELGYDCEWEVLNSKNFGVPQNRERVFIVGHLRGTGGQKVFPIGERIGLGQKTQPENRKEIQTHRCIEGTEYKGYSSERFDGIYQDMKIRRLTPTECERLQGFPDGWTEGISDTQRYKCLGNAVTTNVVEEIGRKILKVIK